MANNRIFYAVQAVKMRPCQTNAAGTAYVYGSERVLRGVQSFGLTTNFNLEQAYQLGQLDLYSNIEEVPDIEITMTKLLDGTRTLYNVATDGSGTLTSGFGNNLTLGQIGDRRADVAWGVWDDTSAVGASGGTSTWAATSGAYVSAVTYNLTSDGNFTEDLTLVSNNLKWNSSHGGITAFNSGINTSETKNIARRWSLSIANSKLPSGSGGGFAFGTTTLPLSDLHINSISVSCNLGREAINQLGQRAPYYRYLNFPIEVTSEFELTSVSGHQVAADDFSSATGCSASYNLADFEIRLAICNPNSTAIGYLIDLGTKNKLTSANQTGGDTGGGNVTVTYSYQTFNSLKVSGVTD